LLPGFRRDSCGAVRELERWRALAPQARRTQVDQEAHFNRVRESPEFAAFYASLPA
jgi:hypothetical protein